jgi:hypothetical protein
MADSLTREQKRALYRDGGRQDQPVALLLFRALLGPFFLERSLSFGLVVLFLLVSALGHEDSPNNQPVAIVR